MALALAGSNLLAPVAGAADAAADLCDTAPAAEINAMTPLHFGDEEPKHYPMFGCTYSPEEGGHSVSFNVFEGDGLIGPAVIEASRAEMAQAEDAVEAQVGDRAGLTATINGLPTLHLEIDGSLLIVAADLPGSAERDGVDPWAFLVGVAEIVMAGIAAVEADSLAPPEVSGIEWRGEREGYGEELADPDGPVGALPWGALLDRLGAEYAQLGFYSVDAATQEGNGAYQAFRVEDADEASLEPAFLAWLSELAGVDEIPSVETTIGGKEVLLLTGPDDATFYVFVAGDTVHLVVLPDAAAADLLGALE